MGTSAAVDASLSSYELCDYIAHEMANPLNGMLMSVELMEEKLRTTPCTTDEIAELPGILKGEIQRLILLLNELRCSNVLLPREIRPVSLPKEIGELLALESAYYAKCGIQVHLDLRVNLPLIMADRNRLRQVVLNLCKNAVGAMPNGGILTLRAYAKQNWLCLDIADTGKGIPEGMRVFERAVTDKPHSNGLGLAIVREIVKQHEGTIEYTTRLGKGTTFHLQFPIPARQLFKPSPWQAAGVT